MESKKVILIGGVDRSGTTMLGSMLGNHTHGVCVPEAQFKRKAITRYRSQGSIKRERLLKILDASYRFDAWKLSRADVKEALPAQIDGAFWYYSLAELYRNEHFPWKVDSDLKYIVDHSPTNVRFPRLYEQFFPEVRFVHIVRDGRGVAKSVMSKDGGANTILNAATYWSDRLCYGLAAEDYLDSDQVIRIRYEDILRRTEQSMKKLAGFIGMNFEPGLCGETDFEATEFSESRHHLVGKAPQADRADAWKDELTERQVELFEANTAELLNHLGYERKFPHTTATPTRFERWSGYLYEQLRIFLDKFRYRWRRLKLYLNR